MKLTEQKLREIVREELTSINEGRSPNEEALIVSRKKALKLLLSLQSQFDKLKGKALKIEETYLHDGGTGYMGGVEEQFSSEWFKDTIQYLEVTTTNNFED